MGEQPLCARCGQPVADTGYICHPCTDRLAQQLASVAQLAGETVVTVARLDRHGDGGHTSAETPMPFDWDASDARWAAHNTIATWARHAARTRGCALPAAPTYAAGPLCRLGIGCRHQSCAAIRERAVDHPTARAAMWLVGQLGWLRVRPEAVEAFDELDDAVALLRRTVDNPGVRWYAGPCRVLVDDVECDGELYARPGADWVRCPACGLEHDAAERRELLLDAARDQLLHAGWMASALSALLGEQVTSAQVRGYAHRGRILAKGVDEQGRATYQVGDVLDVIGRAMPRVA